MMGGYGGYGLLGGFGGLWMLVFWVVVIGLLVWGASGLFAHRASGDGASDALAILKRRYAVGEITEAELETAKRALA